ncbi:MAG: hypothetical protein WC488_01550 [Candidatus Micrarchaeia archaeon]
MARVCIVCEKEPAGEAYPVLDDAIINFIRAAKKKLGLARNNELFVCKECHPTYAERRKKFEKNLVFFIAGGVIIFFVINAFQLFSGRFSVFTFLASIFFGILIASFPVLSYVPAIRQDAGQEAKEEQAARIEGRRPEKPERKAGQKAKPRK